MAGGVHQSSSRSTAGRACAAHTHPLRTLSTIPPTRPANQPLNSPSTTTPTSTRTLPVPVATLPPSIMACPDNNRTLYQSTSHPQKKYLLLCGRGMSPSPSPSLVHPCPFSQPTQHKRRTTQPSTTTTLTRPCPNRLQLEPGRHPRPVQHQGRHAGRVPGPLRQRGRVRRRRLGVWGRRRRGQGHLLAEEQARRAQCGRGVEFYYSG